MAIAFGSTTGPLAYFANSTSLTRSLAVSGSDRFLASWVVGGASNPSGISGVTYNGASLTFLNSVRQGTDLRGDMYYMVAPSTGTNNLTATRSGTGVIVLTGSSYTGVDQTTPIPTSTTGTTSATTSFSAPITTTLSNSWIVVGIRDGSGVNLAESGWVERVENEGTGFGTHFGDTNATVSVGSNTLTGTLSSSVAHGWSIFELAEASTASTFIPRVTWFM